MNITEVRIKAMNVKNEKLKAFASITIEDDFVIRDLKIIVGSRGLFVAMPSRKLSDSCPKCRTKNYLRSKFCNDCGSDLRKTNFGKARSSEDDAERSGMHADIAHPVNSECRDLIQETVVKAYELTVAFPDKRGILTAEYIATTDVPEVSEVAEDLEEVVAESCADGQCACASNEQEGTETANEQVLPEEVIQESVSEVVHAAEEVITEEVVVEETQKSEEPSFTAAAKEAPSKERSKEAPKKKRRFGLGIFS